MSEWEPWPDREECGKCGGSGRSPVHGGMFGHQECSRCDGTGKYEVV